MPEYYYGKVFFEKTPLWETDDPARWLLKREVPEFFDELPSIFEKYMERIKKDDMSEKVLYALLLKDKSEYYWRYPVSGEPSGEEYRCDLSMKLAMNWIELWDYLKWVLSPEDLARVQEIVRKAEDLDISVGGGVHHYEYSDGWKEERVQWYELKGDIHVYREVYREWNDGRYERKVFIDENTAVTVETGCKI